MSDPVEEARRLEVINSPTERYEIWWSPRVSSRVLIPIDVAEAIRAEAVREWETAAREVWNWEELRRLENGVGDTVDIWDNLMDAIDRLRALLPESTAGGE